MKSFHELNQSVLCMLSAEEQIDITDIKMLHVFIMADNAIYKDWDHGSCTTGNYFHLCLCIFDYLNGSTLRHLVKGDYFNRAQKLINHALQTDPDLS